MTAERAAIIRVGVCEELPDGVWFVSGWWFDALNFAGPGVSVGTDNQVKAVAGWTLDELRAISNAEMELAALPTVSR